jgi:hypothetical protein
MILVTGMHRSGTSLVCQLLAAMGVSFGADADRFPSDRWNAAGYFEQKAVMDANSRIVTGWSRNRSRLAAWCSKLVYLCMPGAARIAARAERQRDAIAELGRQYRDAEVKDPRFCLTLPWWQRWTEVQHVVVCMRHPAAVVASLARRDRVPRWLGARFYAWHMRALLPQLPLDRTVFVDVDRLVAGATDELDRLRQRLGLAAGVASATLLQDVVRPAALAAGHEATCPAAAEATWRRLLSVAAGQRQSLAAGPHGG